ncbi:PREDICTED: phosphoinositide phosphatase SAC2-like isoform X2 [Nicotiana attenuata]|uniref:phosphoinositide phosphatase SAC2-like isoform X2 n=1 Tax=Nicotiana attenuata TaxID=49451 RepID=UPI0009055BB6|nr:PREDICTED: phosphoinositide phosphatase SAC2-like isoform X2 [Nicotiana attenuata]
MGSESSQQSENNEQHDSRPLYLQKFRLYETSSNFYMVGRDKTRTFWKVLKIDRLEPSELIMYEDSATYSELECIDLLKRIHEGNKSTGGLKFVSTCYGIVGFVKFLGPYYMVLITKRRKVGMICGHAVYAITKSEMFPIPNSTVLSNMDSKNENRYKKLLRTVDLTKDFFFSYSYHIMLSLQKNLSNCETGLTLYDTMFVWNEFLTRGIRYQLKNTLWTVALVYGFFKQVTLSISDRDFVLTLIARRSRHYAGTRYLKRGVNEKGRVANDVETEQIVLEDMRDGCPVQISAVVQNRGSIPLFWSQETSRLNIKPDIILSRKDLKFEATKRHFENLVKRYGNPIIILNLIKTREKRPRETILRAAFANAIEFINKDLSEENHLRFLHWDLNKHSRSKAANVLTLLGKVAATALDLTGFLHCQLIPASESGKLLKFSSTGNTGDQAGKDLCEVGAEPNSSSGDLCGDYYVKLSTLQRGVLRTNCIDCLDRTNVAQYAYGLVALGHQLHALGFIDVENIDLDSALADNLMKLYEAMGDTLALQYGGSAAHNKIFSERRGQWKAATQSQELFRTLQRYYSNAYMDAEKQDAINVFLGHFRPQEGKPALWELDSDQHYNVGGHGSSLSMENSRSFIKRSLSEGNLICGSSSSVKETDTEQTDDSDQPLTASAKGGSKGLSESTPEISTCETDISFTRYTPSMSGRQLFLDMQLEQCLGSESVRLRERVDSIDFSNFLDIEWLSSSGNSCEEETYERSAIISSPSGVVSSDGVTVESNKAEISFSASESSLKRQEQTSGDLNFDAEGSSKSITEFSEMFVHWVNNGDMLFP